MKKMLKKQEGFTLIELDDRCGYHLGHPAG